MRWLSLFNNGGSMNKIADQADLLEALELRPAWVLIGFNLVMLADEVEPVEPFDLARFAARDFGASPRGVSRAETAPARADLALNKPVSRRPRRPRRLYRFQTGLLRWFGEQIDVQFSPNPDPWTVSRPPLPATPSEQLKAWRRFGCFDPRNYSADGTQARALVQAVRTCRALNACVILIKMPESSVFRSLMPDDAEQRLQTTLETAFDTGTPPVLDLRQPARRPVHGQQPSQRRRPSDPFSSGRRPDRCPRGPGCPSSRAGAALKQP